MKSKQNIPTTADDCTIIVPFNIKFRGNVLILKDSGHSTADKPWQVFPGKTAKEI